MEAIKERRFSNWTHKNNDACRGFFPTSLDVVRMEMELIDLSEIEEGSELTICDLTGGEGDQLKHMYDYIKEKNLLPIAYYNEVTNERYDKAVEKYGHLENFNLLKADFFNLKIRNINNSKKVFTIIRNNPPYTWMEWKGLNIRAEDLFFIKNAEYNVEEGIHIFELPMYQLLEQKTLLKKIMFRYEDVNILKFPEEEFKKFNQVVVIGRKKHVDKNDSELAEKWEEKIMSDNIPYLDKVEKPVIKLTRKAVAKTIPIKLFRDGKVTDLTLTNGFNAVLDELLEASVTKYLKVDLEKEKKIPIIEQTPGHIALDLYSGEYNGLLRNVLVKGGVKKVVKTIVENEKDKKTTIEIENLLPFIEITSANGTSIVKEYTEDNENE